MYILEPYDDALREIIKHGVVKKNRTGVAAKTIFGMQRRYRIDTHFPLLTRRKVWPKAIFGELLWFLLGSTLNADLQKHGSNIWTPWVDPEFETKHNYVSGALGPLYGFQLRYFNGFYGNGALKQQHEVWEEGTGQVIERWDYGHGGFDQLAHMVELLKTDPDSRRNLFSLWNPQQISQMRLPPCHFCFQVYVEDGKLSGHLIQRSADYPVGIPANIQFYSALIYMLAQQCGYEPKEFVHTTSDSHIYVDQIEAVEQYLSRPTSASPRLSLRKAEDIYSYKMNDFEVVDYNPEPPIKVPVAV